MVTSTITPCWTTRQRRQQNQRKGGSGCARSWTARASTSRGPHRLLPASCCLQLPPPSGLLPAACGLIAEYLLTAFISGARCLLVLLMPNAEVKGKRARVREAKASGRKAKASKLRRRSQCEAGNGDAKKQKQAKTDEGRARQQQATGSSTKGKTTVRSMFLKSSPNCPPTGLFKRLRESGPFTTTHGLEKTI